MQNPSSTEFDNDLAAIPHFERFPVMLPYIGPDYIAPDHKKLLLIGESNYLPEDSTIHKDPDTWYEKSESDLTGVEFDWINCRGLLEYNHWERDRLRIYRNLNSCLETLPIAYTDRPISAIAYMNAFQRPATNSGESFEHCCQERDKVESLRVIESVISAIKPDLVVFVSKYAWDTIGSQIKDDIKSSVVLDFVCHPSAHYYWDVENYAHGKQKFLTILKQQFLTTPA